MFQGLNTSARESATEQQTMSSLLISLIMLLLPQVRVQELLKRKERVFSTTMDSQ